MKLRARMGRMMLVVVMLVIGLVTMWLGGWQVYAAETSGGAAPAAGIDWHLVLTGLVPLIVPVVVAIIKGFLPKIPKVWLPVIAIVLPALADLALHFAGAGTPGWLGGLLGAIGIGLREVADQVRKALPD